MKTSLFILWVTFAVAMGASAMAADPVQATPHKTVLKKTSHAAICATPQGKHKKECAYNIGAQSARR